jgi:DNA-binding beta-propeller fold protein YncE
MLGTYVVGSGPNGLAFDGTNMWVVNTGDNSITKLSPAGATLGTFAAGQAPHGGIAYDGTSMWFTDGIPSNSVTRL